MPKIWHLTTWSEQHLTYDLLLHYFKPWRPDLQHFATLNSAVKVQTFLHKYLLIYCNEMDLFIVNAFPRMRWFVPGWPSWYLSAGHWTQSTGHLNSGAASLKSASGHSPCPHLCFKNAQYLFCSRTESQLPCSSTTKQCAQTQSITALDDRKVIFGILELCCTQGHISQSGCPDHNVIGLKDDPTWGAIEDLCKSYFDSRQMRPSLLHIKCF